ncbi:hypothetical protein ACHAWF_003642 [Thalassiosira exigua]
MLGRIRASLTGEPQPTSPPQPPQRNSNNNNQGSPQPQRPGFLPPFLAGAGSPNGGEKRAAPAAALPPQDRSTSSLFGWAAASPPSSVEASPSTIRASAAALLKMATPPPFSDNNAHPDIKPNTSNDSADNADQRDSLEHQVGRRDAYIGRLQSDLDKMQPQLAQYQRDHHTLRRQVLESTHRHAIAIKLWRRTNDGLRARVECFENETTPAAAREIANLIRDAAPPNKDSAYLMMLQDQLAKATVKLDHLGSQTEIVLHKGEEVVESLREEMNEVIRERCRMELELLDQERMLEDDMRRMVMKTERRLKRVQGEIDFLEKNAVECLKNQEEEGSDSDGDENGEVGEKGKYSGKDGDERKGEADEEGEDGSSSGGDSGKESNGEQDKATESDDDSKEREPDSKNNKDSKGETRQHQQRQTESQHTPELLRKELRQIAAERDRSLSVLQKKLREKNEEYQGLARLREGRLKAIRKLEAEQRDREEWERSRQEGLMP